LRDMKIKVVGFKVGKSRPTANRQFDTEANHAQPATRAFALLMFDILEKSDFVSIRRVDE